MLLACDPRLLLYTTADVQAAQALLQRYQQQQQYDDKKDTDTLVVNDRALWEAQRVVTAALHPDTGAVIPRPFRMSGYVPYNGRKYIWECIVLVA
jgi:hypothetical protein